MLRNLTCMALILVGLNVRADIDAAKVNYLENLVATQGDGYDMGNGSYLMALSYNAPDDTSISHQANYIDDIGYVDENNQFVVTEFAIGWEDWQLGSDNNWHIDQWIYTLTLDGQTKDIFHSQLVEDQDSNVLQDDQLEVDATNPDVRQALSDKIDSWYADTTVRVIDHSGK